jgi:hypothetical protein
MMEDLETEWKRKKDKAALMEWLLVRTLSDPCEFNTSSPDANVSRSWWNEATKNDAGRKNKPKTIQSLQSWWTTFLAMILPWKAWSTGVCRQPQ